MRRLISEDGYTLDRALQIQAIDGQFERVLFWNYRFVVGEFSLYQTTHQNHAIQREERIVFGVLHFHI